MASRVTGRNQKITERAPEVLIGVSQKQPQESPSREVRMALHSEVQAEESHQEQGEDAETLDGHGSSS